MEELKPCPFCGGEAVLVEKTSYGGNIFVRVECKLCGAMAGNESISLYHSAAERAIERWNRRIKRCVKI